MTKQTENSNPLKPSDKFPLSPASLIDSAIAEDMMSNCDSIEDGDSQGDIDMEDPVSGNYLIR